MQTLCGYCQFSDTILAPLWYRCIITAYIIPLNLKVILEDVFFFFLGGSCRLFAIPHVINFVKTDLMLSGFLPSTDGRGLHMCILCGPYLHSRGNPPSAFKKMILQCTNDTTIGWFLTESTQHSNQRNGKNEAWAELNFCEAACSKCFDTLFIFSSTILLQSIVYSALVNDTYTYRHIQEYYKSKMTCKIEIAVLITVFNTQD